MDAGFDNTPSADLQEKREKVGLKPLPRGVKVYAWTESQLWHQAANGATSVVTQEALSRSKVRLARFGLPCDASAIAEFQRYSGGYTIEEPCEPVPDAWATEMQCGAHVTYAVKSGRCRFELSQATRNAAAGDKLVVRATAGDGVTCLMGVPHRLVPEAEGTELIPLFDASTTAESRVRQAVLTTSDSGESPAGTEAQRAPTTDVNETWLADHRTSMESAIAEALIATIKQTPREPLVFLTQHLARQCGMELRQCDEGAKPATPSTD